MKNIVLFLSLVLCSSCYSFKGISIPPEVKTYYVEDVEVDRSSASNLPVNLPNLIGENLKQKIQDESRLILNENEPHIIFKATIKRYGLQSVAPEEGSTTALERLELNIFVEYTNTLNEEENWKKSFADFEDFASNLSLLDVEDELIDSILEDVLDRIFNEAFTNW